jgi:hypothetical protein
MKKIYQFFDNTFLDIGRQFKLTYLPPLMVYVAAGISGLTGIVGTFFVKDYLNLSAAFLAGFRILGRYSLGSKNASWTYSRSNLEEKKLHGLFRCIINSPKLIDNVWTYHSH